MYSKILSLAIVLLCSTGTIWATVQSQEISYEIDGDEFKGYVSFDDASDELRPAVLVVHEWWGHNAYARKRTEQLAQEGYLAFALDMYGGGQNASHPSDAGKFSGKVMKDLPLAKKRFQAAMEVLQEHPLYEDGKIAAIGYCFGGGVVLHMARMGLDLDAVVSFHGSLKTATPATLGVVKAEILVCHGADDPFVPQTDIDALEKEMTDAGVVYQFKAYPGAKHSFTNPDANRFGQEFNLPLEYNEAADKQSWFDMLAVFNRVFKEN